MAMTKQSELLEAAVQSLDIPDELHDLAVAKYEEIGDWLVAEDSDLKGTSPEIYPQGSFRLGTVVRPYGKEDQYDIDLVCRLTYQKDSIAKAELKKKIGDRLKKNVEYKAILKESRRAWTLDYPQQFHLDVLSSIPNVERRPNGILLPDKELHYWQKSNPITFADWFYGRMAVILREKRAVAARLLEANVEDVPEWQVRTPLQRAVQILKRHRDVWSANKVEIRPVSIIITTLAAKSYNNEADIADALQGILQGMHQHIEKRDDKWWVENPAEPEENFAERWNEYPERREAFFRWLIQARNDFAKATPTTDIRNLAEALSPALGRSTMTKAAAAVGVDLNASRGGVLVEAAKAADQVPALSSTSHKALLQWPLDLRYKAEIKATVHRKIHHRKVLWPLTNRAVLKGAGLHFTVSTNTPWPYEVRWQITNTGKEARDAKQLRGGFDTSDSGTPNSRWESTAFAGTHLVEAFVIKNGQCVAKSSPKQVRVRGGRWF